MSYIIGNHIEDIDTKNPAKVEENRLYTQSIFDPSITTAFGNLAVASPYTMFEFDSVYGNNTLLEEFTTSLASGGTTTVPTNGHPGIQMNVTSTAGSSVLLQSKEYIRYQKGKEQRIIWTNQLGNHVSGIRKREGYFDGSDGLFFQRDENGIWSVNVRSSITGSTQFSITRNDWDDPLDGTGVSGYNFDLAKFFLKGIRFSWLGTNLVQFGILYDQKFVPCHTFNFGGLLDFPYMKTPHLPMRFEITNISSSTGDNMIPTCGSVLSMGGVEEYFEVKSVDNNGFQAVNSGQFRILLLIRLNSNFIRTKVSSLRFTSITDVNGQYRYTVWKNPTFSSALTPGTWSPVGSNSFLDFYPTITATPFVTGGTKLISTGVSINNQNKDVADLSLDIPIQATIDGVSDILALTVNGTNNSTQFSAIQWREYK